MKLHALRLTNGQDLRQELMKFCAANKIEAGAIMTCVGALQKTNLRMAGATPNNQILKELEEPMEIIALSGTISQHGCHLHLAVSTKNGQMFGGHLKDGSIIGVTCEVVIAEHVGSAYLRHHDQSTGFDELVIKSV